MGRGSISLKSKGEGVEQGSLSFSRKGICKMSNEGVSLVKSVVLDKVRGRELFTSLDISKQLKAVSYKCVRECLHELWFTGEISGVDYTRTLGRMASGKNAYIYGPRGTPDSIYTNRGQASNLKHIQHSIPSIIQDNLDKGKPRASLLSRYIRSDGSIEISGALVNKINAQAGSILYGWFDTPKQELVVSVRPPYTGACSFRVYKTGETRIPKSLVSTCLFPKDDFSVRVQGDELRIF